MWQTFVHGAIRRKWRSTSHWTIDIQGTSGGHPAMNIGTSVGYPQKSQGRTGDVRRMGLCKEIVHPGDIPRTSKSDFRTSLGWSERDIFPVKISTGCPKNNLLWITDIHGTSFFLSELELTWTVPVRMLPSKCLSLRMPELSLAIFSRVFPHLFLKNVCSSSFLQLMQELVIVALKGHWKEKAFFYAASLRSIPKKQYQRHETHLSSPEKWT